MNHPTLRVPLRVSALAAAALLAACSDEPTGPSLMDRAGPLLSTVSSGLPERISNAVKYRDAGLKPATGRAGSATLTVRALLGKDGKTDLEMTTGELDTSATAPGNISKIQVKLFDPSDRLQYTKNFNALKQGGYVAQKYEDRARHSKMQVQTNIDGIDPNRTGVVTVTEVIKLRPDLRVSDLTAPEKAKVHTTVNIGATISEINTDVGARANCVLYIDGAEADRADGVWVDAGGVVSCAFTHTFKSTGSKSLEVRAEGVVPGDYDSSNNAVSGSIQITAGSDFYTGAYAHDLDIDHKWRGWGTWRNSTYNGQWDYNTTGVGTYQVAGMWGWMPHEVSFPLTGVSVTHATAGKTVLSQQYENLSADYSHSWGDSSYGGRHSCVARTAVTDDYYWYNWMYVCSGNYSYDGQQHPHTWISSHRWAGDVTYHSEGYSITWYNSTGEVYDSYTHNRDDRYTWGTTLVDYGSDYSFTFDVKADGQTYSTAPVVPLAPVKWHWDNLADPWCGTYTSGDHTSNWCNTYSHTYTGVHGWTWVSRDN